MNKPILQPLDNSRTLWRLVENYTVEAGFGVPVTVPVDFVTDLASIPSPFWPLVGHPANHAGPAVIHDMLCRMATSYEERVIADAVFLKLTKDNGSPYWRRALMYMALRSYAFCGLWGRDVTDSKRVKPMERLENGRHENN